MIKNMKKIIHIFLGVLLLGGVAYALVATYLRVIEKGEYAVEYRISCDPSTQPCFSEKLCDDLYLSCETEFYSLIRRTAGELEQLCGPSLSQCEYAESCTKEEQKCFVTLCDPSIETCSFIESGIE